MDYEEIVASAAAGSFKQLRPLLVTGIVVSLKQDFQLFLPGEEDGDTKSDKQSQRFGNPSELLI